MTVDLVHAFIGGQIIELVTEDGATPMVKDFIWDTGGEPHTTFTVGASALPANGTWKLRVTDNTPASSRWIRVAWTAGPRPSDGRVREPSGQRPVRTAARRAPSPARATGGRLRQGPSSHGGP
ncbi:hypothetical protein ACIBAI_07850 [Streptomyces sp. NPDC051041]|uniref:hypothetical protein n=1 Tax=Streptomyces sp. NPDC051041 TaxID=3365640 RepID=UPI0037A1E5E8